MNGHSIFSRIVGFFRAGYSADAPQLGHVALIAMCPRPLASYGRLLRTETCPSEAATDSRW